MKYLVFSTQAEAEAAEQAIWQGMAPQIVETRDGEPVPEAERVTKRWAVPMQIADGRWAFPCPCGADPEPVEACEDWWPQDEVMTG
jgi:hypothetical protein